MLIAGDYSVRQELFCCRFRHNEAPKAVLSVPHDGQITNDLCLFSQRQSGIHGRDAHVWPIVSDVIARSSEQGVPVDAIRFLMPRAYVDANRSHGEALDDERLAETYHCYHCLLKESVERSQEAHGNAGVLLDMHGFGTQPDYAPSEGYDVILGTSYRKTVGESDIDRRFHVFLTERGYRVFLPSEQPVNPTGGDRLSGQFTVNHYASTYGIPSVQVEIAPKFRSRETQHDGERLAVDIADFLTTI